MLEHRRIIALVTLCAACGGSGEPAWPADAPWPVAVERAEPAEPPYERVVLVTLDTLRADHVSCYGYPRATTPFLDSLAARGVRFERALAAVSHTAPSHATMLTGLVPAVHGVVHNGGELDPAAADLAEVFGAAGYETAAFLNVHFLSGIAASFGHVEVRAVGGEKGQRHPLDGGHVVDAALEWTRAAREGERFLLWVHLYDPHKWKDLVLELEGTDAPLWKGATPEGFLGELLDLHGLPRGKDGETRAIEWHVEKKSGEELDVATPERFLRCVDAYDALTLFADGQVERLYRGIEALGLPGRTLWVVTSDHGEGLASHGIAGHGSRIYQEQLAVPLIVHASDGSLGPRVVGARVAHVDLLPTLAEAAGARVRGNPALYDGRSLWPLVNGAAEWPERALFAQRRPAENDADPDQAEVYALQDGLAKYILHEPGADEFYDLARDPLELEDLGGEAAAARQLRTELERRLRVYGALSPARPQGDVPEEWMEELRDLGYVR